MNINFYPSKAFHPRYSVRLGNYLFTANIYFSSLYYIANYWRDNHNYISKRYIELYNFEYDNYIVNSKNIEFPEYDLASLRKCLNPSKK